MRHPFVTDDVRTFEILNSFLVCLAVLLSTMAMGKEVVPLDGGLRFFSDTGLPAADLTVTLVLKGHWEGEEHLSWSTTTDSKGRFEIPDLLPRRTYALTVRGAAYPVFNPIDLVAVGSVRRRIVPIPIPPARCHTGKVSDEDGKPIGGASVCLLFRRFLHPPVAFPHFFEGEFVRTYETASDPEGRFSFWTLVTDSEGVAKATHQGRAPALVVVRPSTIGSIQLSLHRATEISGRVIDTWGKPVSGQTVVAAPRIPCGTDWVALLTSFALSRADGSFTLSGIRPDQGWNVFPANALRGIVWKGGDAQEGLELITESGNPEEEDRDEASGKTARFLGKVLDAASGKPIEGAEIQLWPPGHTKHTERGTATSPDGSFEVRDLHPDSEWLLWVRALGHAPAFYDVILPGGDLEKSFRLEPVTPVRVICRDASGAPLANVRIAMPSHTSDLAHLYARGTTDTRGECILDERLPGRLEMVSIIPFDDGRDAFGLEVPLEEGVANVPLAARTIRGTVKSTSGQPLPGAEVSFGRENKVFTDEDGTYVLPRAGLGDHSIGVSARRYSTTRISPVKEIKSEDLVLDPSVVQEEGHLVQLVDDLGEPLAGIFDNDEVSDGAGFLHVGSRDSLGIYLPFYQNAFVTDDSMKIEEEDVKDGKLVAGVNRIVLARRGRILIRFDDSIARKLQHAWEEIEADGPEGRKPGPCDRSFRIAPAGSGIVLSRLAPGRWTLHFRRLGSYLPFVLADIEVKALQTTMVDAPALLPGATIIVDLGKYPKTRRYPIGISLDDRCKFICEDATGNTRTVLGFDAGKLDQEEYIIEGLPDAGQLEIDVGGFYAAKIPVKDLEPGKEHRVAPALDPWPTIKGKVLRKSGEQKLLGLRFNPEKSGEGSPPIVDIEGDGTFGVSLPDGRYSISAVIPGQFGGEEEDPSGAWRVVIPDSAILKRSEKEIDIQVTVEWIPATR